MSSSEKIEILGNLLKKEAEKVDSVPAFNSSWMQSEPKIQIDEFTMRKLLKSKKKFSVIQIAGVAALFIFTLGVPAIYILQRNDSDQTADDVAAGSEKIRGLVTRVKGDVFLEKNGVRQPLIQGKVVERGDYIETESGEVDIALWDGTSVRLKNEGRFRFEKLNRKNEKMDTEIYLEKGKIYNAVTKLSSEDTYIVKSPTAIAGVRGTLFTVSVDNEKTQINTIEGSLSVSSSKGIFKKEQILEKGNAVVFKENGKSNEFIIDDLNAEKKEFNELNMPRSDLDKEILSVAQSLSDVKSEEDLKKHYKKDLIEIARMKDGRELHGVVVSQVGSKIIFQTVTDSYVFEAQDISEISYKEEK